MDLQKSNPSSKESLAEPLAYRSTRADRANASWNRWQRFQIAKETAVVVLLCMEFLTLVGIFVVSLIGFLSGTHVEGLIFVLTLPWGMWVIGRILLRTLRPKKTGYEDDDSTETLPTRLLGVAPLSLKAQQARDRDGNSTQRASLRIGTAHPLPVIVSRSVSTANAREVKRRWRRLKVTYGFGAVGNGIISILFATSILFAFALALGVLAVYRPVMMMQMFWIFFGKD